MTKCDFCQKWNPNYPCPECIVPQDEDKTYATREEYCNLAIDKMMTSLKSEVYGRWQ